MNQENRQSDCLYHLLDRYLDPTSASFYISLRRVLVSLFLASLSISAYSQGDPKACLTGAAWATQSYVALQTLDREFPSSKEQNLADVRKAIYDYFKKQVAENSAPAAVIFEAQRAWKELGVKDYIANSSLLPVDYERRRYEGCIRSRP